VACQRAHWRVHKPGCVATASGSRTAEQPAQEHDRPVAVAATATPAAESEQAESAAPPHTTQDMEHAVPAPEGTSSTQQAAHPQPAGGSSKRAKDNQRKERQRQRKIEEATETLNVAMAAMEQTGVR
jgi:hypothetical protein